MRVDGFNYQAVTFFDIGIFLSKKLHWYLAWKCNSAPKAYAHACGKIILWCQNNMKKIRHICLCWLVVYKAWYLRLVLGKQVECQICCTFRVLNYLLFCCGDIHAFFCTKLYTNMNHSNKKQIHKISFILFYFLNLLFISNTCSVSQNCSLPMHKTM
jgi:hypothetical protein